MQTLTVVCPAYNEAEVIESFYRVLRAELRKLSEYRSEILFVVDGGDDGTFGILAGIAQRDPDVRVLKLSKNFGHQMALIAGIDHAKGDAVIMMDADLQHPPALIPRLLEKYQEGSEVVYTIRVGERIGLLRKLAGTAFYRFVNLISDVPIVENASDFRLISKRVADIMRVQIHERDLFLRGLVGWLGLKQASVQFTPGPRAAGKSKYSLGRLFQFALIGLVSFSKRPLRFATVAGALLAFFGFLFAALTIVQYFVDATLPPGWATVVVLLSIFGGIQLIVLGILGEYIGVIFDEVKGRPRYIIEKAVNFPPEPGARSLNSQGWFERRP